MKYNTIHTMSRLSAVLLPLLPLLLLPILPRSAPAHARAQSHALSHALSRAQSPQSQSCTFHLYQADIPDISLGQLPDGLIQGGSAEHSGTLFVLRDGALYDLDRRGCWWAGKFGALTILGLPTPLSRSPITEAHNCWWW